MYDVSAAVKISPVKQSQLRNFLSKGQMPPVRSTAPGTRNLWLHESFILNVQMIVDFAFWKSIQKAWF